MFFFGWDVRSTSKQRHSYFSGYNKLYKIKQLNIWKTNYCEEIYDELNRYIRSCRSNSYIRWILLKCIFCIEVFNIMVLIPKRNR